MLLQDLLLLSTEDFGGTSDDPTRPDYACPAWREQAPRWQLVEDIRGGTIPIRRKKAFYLPRFEAETLADWESRIGMTFVADHYATTLVEHVGLVMAQPPKMGDDVPDAIRALVEDIDGEGNHLDVFSASALDTALHQGHCVLFTDYPVTAGINTLADAKAAKARPYVTLYPASDVLSWRSATVGGVRVLTQIVFRETTTEPDGTFGIKDCTRYREITQQVFYDEVSGRATGLGGITWRLFRRDADDAATVASAETAPSTTASPAASFTLIGEGPIVGPDRICARVVYGGQKVGLLQSIPHLMGLALSNVEETQVMSDYASVMHKCNVPTPIFIGRNITMPGEDTGKPIQMGQGIDIPVGGDAKMLEPSGAALGATRQRIDDIRTQMRRQGATSGDETGKVMTAIEAKIYAKQRNAKLSRAARSLQDALEGVFADFAAFMGLSSADEAVTSGGSLIINQDYSGDGIDPVYLQVLVSAYTAGAMPLDALLYALEKGKLPEDFSASDSALHLIADEMARQDAADAQAKQLAENPPPVVVAPAVAPAPNVAPNAAPLDKAA